MKLNLHFLEGMFGMHGHVVDGGLLLGARGRVRVHVHGCIHKNLCKEKKR